MTAYLLYPFCWGTILRSELYVALQKELGTKMGLLDDKRATANKLLHISDTTPLIGIALRLCYQ